MYEEEKFRALKHPVIFTNFIQASRFGVEFFFYFPVLLF